MYIWLCNIANFSMHAIYLKNLKVTALLENGMYYIPVCGMYASYICIDIMYASYYGACIYGYAILQTSVCMQFT